MGPVHRRALNRSRRVSFLKKDQEGVASTVGTIMALMVFIAFMALITNSYVPAWMMDNERSHMNQVTGQFGTLKGNIDSMILQQRVTGDNSIKMYAPIKLGSEGVPLFATATVGLLSYVPQSESTSGVRVQFNESAPTSTGGTVTVPWDVSGGGRVDLYVPNRYYVPQWVCYENGAILVKQDDGQSIKAYPNLDISKTGSSIAVAFTQIDLVGASQSLTGSDAVGFSLDLIFVDSQEKIAIGGPDNSWHLTVTTEYGDAWLGYFIDVIADAGLAAGEYRLVSTDLDDDVTKIDLTLYNVSSLTYNRASMEMTLLTT